MGVEILGIQLLHQVALGEALGRPLNLKEAAHRLALAAASSAGITDANAVDRIAQAAVDQAKSCSRAGQCSACRDEKEFGDDFAG